MSKDHRHDHDHDHDPESASEMAAELRAEALESLLVERGLLTSEAIDRQVENHRIKLGRHLAAGKVPEISARLRIHLPTYRHVLENRLRSEVDELRAILAVRPVVLLDYETNTDVADLARPLSHAGLVAAWVHGEWPGGRGR